MEILFLLTGLFIGIAGTAVILLTIRKSKELAWKEKNMLLTNSINDLELKLNEKQNAIVQLSKELAEDKANYKNLQEKYTEQKKEIETIQEKFRIEFKNLANEILDEKSRKFTEQNKTSINEILNPLNQKIKEFEKKVEETYDKEAQQRFSLKEEVKRLAELNQQVSKEANNLTKALKGESKTQGNWGEIILENILEKSGLVKDREYFVQNSFTTEEGKRLQPDVVVTYPGERSIVIDSKVSLTAYEKYISAEEELEKEQYLKEHLNSINNHIIELSNKNYQDIYQLKSMDFVMLFMPVEPAYLLAIQHNPAIWNVAYDKRVLLISPTNLIAALKMIVSLWRQEYQNKHALEIAKKSGELYDKFVGLVDDLLDVGHKLKQTQKSYEGSMNKLSTGKGNLVKRAQDLKELGVKTQKNLPGNLIERAESEAP